MSKLAFVFPGQGSQSVGMLDSLAGIAEAQATLAEADAALGFALSELIASGPSEELALTVNTQPAMLAAGVAIYRVYLARGGRVPDIVAGHSLGEYTALVAAGVLGFADALRTVRLRAQAMQRAVPAGEGAMAAILGLEAADVEAACAQVSACGPVVEAANFNDPKQTVISGSKAGVEQACELLKARGAKRAVLLPVSAPFHSSLMKPAADELREVLAGLSLQPPRIDLINNIDVAVEADPARIRDALYRQAFGPVRWAQCMQKMVALGATRVVECGPGKVLAGLARRADGQVEALAMSDAASIDEAVAATQREREAT